MREKKKVVNPCGWCKRAVGGGASLGLVLEGERAGNCAHVVDAKVMMQHGEEFGSQSLRDVPYTGRYARMDCSPSTLEISSVMSSKRSACPQCETPLQDAGTSFCPKCSFPLMLIAGKYRLERALEKGGFGTVYLAHHTGLTRDTERVIKVIEPGMFAEEESQVRFRREVELTSSLSQRNNHIVRIYDDFGREPELGYYYVMEYLRGKPLSHVMCPGKALHAKLIFLLMEQLCSALDAAHREHIVHRDLKPPNIFLIERDKNPCFVKILDFGIAKPLSETGAGVTRHILGTPHYMSPEQCLNEPVDARSDLYALGMLFYHMSTGTHPFQKLKGGSDFAVMQAQISQPAMSMREKRSDLPISRDLDRVVLKAIEKEADDRYPTAAAFWAALRPFAPPPSSLSELQGLLAEAVAIRALDMRRRNPVKPATVSLGPDDALSEAREESLEPPPSSDEMVDLPPPTSPTSYEMLADSVEQPVFAEPPAALSAHLASEISMPSADARMGASPALVIGAVGSIGNPAGNGRSAVAHPKDTVPLDLDALDFLHGEARVDDLRAAMRSMASSRGEAAHPLPLSEGVSPVLEMSADLSPVSQKGAGLSPVLESVGGASPFHPLVSSSGPSSDGNGMHDQNRTEEVYFTEESALFAPPKITAEQVLALQSAAPTEEVHHFVLPEHRPATPSFDSLSSTVPVGVENEEHPPSAVALASDGTESVNEESEASSERAGASRGAVFVLLLAMVAVAVGIWTQRTQWFGPSTQPPQTKPTSRSGEPSIKQGDPTEPNSLALRNQPSHPLVSSGRLASEPSSFVEERSLAPEPPPPSLDAGQAAILPEQRATSAPDHQIPTDAGKEAASMPPSTMPPASPLPVPKLMVFSRGNAERTGVYDAKGLQGFRRRVVWRKKTKGNVNTSPVVVGSAVYFGADDGFFYAVQLADGEEIWKRKIGARIVSSPLVVDDMVYFGSWDHSLYALRRKDGATLWHHKAKGSIDGAPAADRDRVYFGSDDYHIYAVDRANGRLVWKYKTGRLISAAPTLSGGTLFVGSNDGFLYAMDAKTGSERWRFQTKGRISGAAAVAGGMVYFGSSDQSVYAVDAVTGKQRWVFETGGEITASPAVSEKEIYIGSHDGSVYALDRTSGKLVWRFHTRGKVLSSPAIWGEEVLFKSQDRYLYAVNIRTKRRHWRMRLGLSWAGAAPVPADRFVLIGVLYPAGLWAIQ